MSRKKTPNKHPLNPLPSGRALSRYIKPSSPLHPASWWTNEPVNLKSHKSDIPLTNHFNMNTKAWTLPQSIAQKLRFWSWNIKASKRRAIQFDDDDNNHDHDNNCNHEKHVKYDLLGQSFPESEAYPRVSSLSPISPNQPHTSLLGESQLDLLASLLAPRKDKMVNLHAKMSWITSKHTGNPKSPAANQPAVPLQCLDCHVPTISLHRSRIPSWSVNVCGGRSPPSRI